jgi:hypothetical protein
MNGYRQMCTPHVHHRVLFSHKEEWNDDKWGKMEGTGDYYVKLDKPDKPVSQRQVLHAILCETIWGGKKGYES